MRPLLVALALCIAPLASAQTADSAESDAEAAVRAAIADLFDGMRAADTTAMRATLHPAARLATTAAPDGSGYQESPISAFLAAVAGAPVDLDERLTDDYPVQVDGPLATAWTPYAFYAGGQFSHCGVNAFTLAETPDGWRIVHIMDTRRPACDGPAGDL